MNLVESWDQERSMTSSAPVWTILMERSFSDCNSSFQNLCDVRAVAVACLFSFAAADWSVRYLEDIVWRMSVPPSPAEAR